MATCSLGNQSSQNCIDKADFEIDVSLEKDLVGLCNMDDMICWDQVFTEEV